MGFEIEKGIPVPSQSFGHRYARYPWREMEIGDSFLVKCSRSKERQAISASATQFSRRNPEYKFITRSDLLDGVIHVRVWRVGGV